MELFVLAGYMEKEELDKIKKFLGKAYGNKEETEEVINLLNEFISKINDEFNKISPNEWNILPNTVALSLFRETNRKVDEINKKENKKLTKKEKEIKEKLVRINWEVVEFIDNSIAIRLPIDLSTLLDHGIEGDLEIGFDTNIYYKNTLLTDADKKFLLDFLERSFNRNK